MEPARHRLRLGVVRLFRSHPPRFGIAIPFQILRSREMQFPNQNAMLSEVSPKLSFQDPSARFGPGRDAQGAIVEEPP